ncbi:MAG TPA: hypothetical protein VFS21_38655 [Roseiflexaceae bacterium]|nr:hypothetical protein [Roseiflexaceae bacterium]
MALIIGASAVVLIILVVVVALVFRPSKGFKPETTPSGYTMSADKPLVLRYPGPSPDGSEGEVRDTLHSVDSAPRDMLFRAGDAPLGTKEAAKESPPQQHSN